MLVSITIGSYSERRSKVGFGESNRASTKPSNKEMNCKECGQELREVSFKGGTYFICRGKGEGKGYQPCSLYHQPQGLKPNRVVLRNHKAPGGYGSWPTYWNYLEQRKGNRRKLDEYGFPYWFCNRSKTNKQTERISKMLKRGLSVGYITEMLSKNGQNHED